MSRNEESQYDFFSSAFNPYKALYKKDLKAPVSDVQVRDNISRCKDLLPPNHPDYISKNTLDAKKSQLSKTKQLKFQKKLNKNYNKSLNRPDNNKMMNNKEIKEKIKKNIYTQFNIHYHPTPQALKKQKEMLKTTQLLPNGHFAIKRKINTPINIPNNKVINKNSPFELLKTIYKEQCKVKVYLRSMSELRSIMTGLLIAFDHHFNMLLMDVNEIYVSNKKNKKKYIKQVLLRGDNVILVTRA